LHFRSFYDIGASSHIQHVSFSLDSSSSKLTQDASQILDPHFHTHWLGRRFQHRGQERHNPSSRDSNNNALRHPNTPQRDLSHARAHRAEHADSSRYRLNRGEAKHYCRSSPCGFRTSGTHRDLGWCCTSLPQKTSSESGKGAYDSGEY
jgi:hypothetical protein